MELNFTSAKEVCAPKDSFGNTGCFKKSFTTPLQLIPQLDEDDQE